MKGAHAFIAAAVAAAVLAGPGTTAGQARHVSIRTQGFPGHLETGFGSVWVLDHRLGFVYRIDPRTNRRVSTIHVGESLCNDLAMGAGAVWVHGCDTNVTYKIDPATNHVVGKRDGIIPVFGAGSLWTTTLDGAILRIDPSSGVILARIDPRIDVKDTGGGAAYGAGSIWVTADKAVSRIDVQTNKVTAVIPLPGAKRAKGDYRNGYLYANFGVFAKGRFWDTNAAGLYVVNPASNIAKLIHLKIHVMTQFGDADLTAGKGSIWVRSGNRTVTRVSERTGKIVGQYPAGGEGGGIAFGFGSLWIANFYDGTVWRERIGSAGRALTASAVASSSAVADRFVAAANQGDYATVCHLYSRRYLKVSQAACRALYRWGESMYGPFDYRIVGRRRQARGRWRIDLVRWGQPSFIALRLERAGWRIVAGGW